MNMSNNQTESRKSISLTTRLVLVIALLMAPLVMTLFGGYYIYSQPVHEFNIGIGLLLGGALTIAITAVLLLRRTILQPIQDLDTGFMHLGQGELDFRIESHSDDELGQLTHTFNQMAEAIERDHNHEAARIRELQLANEELQQESIQYRQTAMQREKFLLAIEETDDYVIFTDEKGLMEYVNPAVVSATGFQREELIGNGTDIFKSGNHDDAFFANMWQTIAEGHTFRDVFVNCKKDGSLFYEEKTITPMVDGQGKRHYVSTGRDITEQIETHDRLYHLAHHDMLTGLGNRIMLVDRLEQALTRADRNETMVGVLFLDLDRFKAINDTLGHNVGDKLLKEIARRLSQCTREGDILVRLGGDEFVIIADGVKHITDVTTLVDRVIQSVSEEVVVNGNELSVTASIGITLYPLDYDNVDGLLKHADTAMYRAKEGGRNTYEFYTHDMTKQVNARIKLEDELRNAVQKKAFTLNYLPEVDLHTGDVVGLEALLRWRNSNGKEISPYEFIPILEDTGLILELGEWVLQEACQFMHRLHESGFDQINMAVNLSTKQFQHADIIKIVSSALESSPSGHLCLELEITENMLLNNAIEAGVTLSKLSELGVSIALDDFGTGYSSLKNMKRLPIDILKVDRSFIKEVTLDPECDAIVSAAIALAHSLKLKVVAEGVETDRQRAFLALQGCDFAQGYLYTRPLPEEKILAWLSSAGLENVS